MTNEERKRLSELVSKVAEDLGEHYDAVQIMACSCDEDGTSSFYGSAGNYFARIGLAHELIGFEEAKLTGKGVARELNR